MIQRRIKRGAAVQPTGLRRPLAIALGATVLIGGLIMAIPAGVAGASPQISIIPNQPVPGQRVTVRGSGFCGAPCTPVKITVDGSLAAGAVPVAPDGTFSVDVGLTPVSGNSTIVASQMEANGAVREASAVVRIVAADQTPGPVATPTPEPPAPTGSTPPPASVASIAPSAPTTSVGPSPSPAESGSATVAPPATSGSPSTLVQPASDQGQGLPWTIIAVVLALIAVALGAALVAVRRRRTQST